MLAALTGALRDYLTARGSLVEKIRVRCGVWQRRRPLMFTDVGKYGLAARRNSDVTRCIAG